MSHHKALRTYDILECIFSFLDVESLTTVCRTCSLWKECSVQSLLWKKLAFRFAFKSKYNLTILSQKGLKSNFDNIYEESDHYESLCKKFTNFKRNWKIIEPQETFLCCAPADVNKNFGFEWTPWWQWKNQGGWIASFTFDEKYLLCGVIETLQVWDLEFSKCISILETPRDDIIVGVDIALNCLDLLGDLAVSGSNEGIIRVWNIKSEKYCKRLDCSEYGAVNALKLLNNFFLSGHDDGQLIIWLVKSFEDITPLSTLVHHTDIVWGLDFSSKFVVTCSEDKSVAVYLHSDIFPNCSQAIITPTNKLKENHVSGLLLSRLVGHEASVTCVSIEEDIVVTGSRDKSVRVWLVGNTDYVLLKVLFGHSELVHYVAQDQDRFYSSDDNGELLVWDKKIVLDRRDGAKQNNILLRRLDFGERGAIDCIKIMGSKVLTSCDDFGNIAINDFW